MELLNVLICGGGIAGNALAFWLSKQGHNVTVIERFSTLRDTGLQVDLRGHGIEVMRRMGLEDAFREKSIQEQGLEFVNSSGKQRGYFPANRSGKGLQSFTTDFEIMRGDLCRLIYEASKDRVKYVFGMSIQSFEEVDGSVKVIFSDDSTGSFDLLVGADGQGSRTRRMMLASKELDPIHPLGVYTAYFTIPSPAKAGEGYKATTYIAPERRIVFTRRHDPSLKQIYLTYVTKSRWLGDVQRGDVREEKKAFAEVFQNAGWQTDQALESMKDATDFYCERMGVVKLDSWCQGRVALLGDAAYCPSATTGMGTTSSLVGAYILAGEISEAFSKDGAKETDLALALKNYDCKFRPFMDQVQQGLAEGHTLFDQIPSSAWGIGVLHLLISIAAFLRLDFLAKFFLRENVQQWTLPDYENMTRKHHL